MTALKLRRVQSTDCLPWPPGTTFLDGASWEAAQLVKPKTFIGQKYNINNIVVMAVQNGSKTALTPGRLVAYWNKDQERHTVYEYAKSVDDAVGIIDPAIPNRIPPGDMFYLYLLEH